MTAEIINVTIEEHEYGTSTFADIKVGDLVWSCYHSWSDDTDQADGYWASSDGSYLSGLDMWSTEALLGDYESRQDEIKVICELAEVAWAEGKVYFSPDIEMFGAPTLVIPGAGIKPLEALNRFRP